VKVSGGEGEWRRGVFNYFIRVRTFHGTCHIGREENKMARGREGRGEGKRGGGEREYIYNIYNLN
jgi:hypothetical protein